MKPKGNNLFIISGPSGSGKDAVISEMRKQGFKFAQVITMTTRRKRKGEAEGNPYHFVSKDEFTKLKKENKLIEWAEVFGHYYGATKEEVETKLTKFPFVVYKIDPRFGAGALKKLYPGATSIFIIPESKKVLTGRVAERKSDSSKSKELREKEREDEYKNIDQWDEVVINKEGELNKTAKQVRAIIKSKTVKRKHKKVITALAIFIACLLVLVSTLAGPGLVKKHQLKKEFANYLDYLEAIPTNAKYVIASTNGLAENFVGAEIGQKGFLFIDQDNNSALVIKSNDQATLSAVIRRFWGYRYPSTRVFSLPDGSYSYEYFPNPDKFEVKSSELSGVTVNSIINNDLGIQMSWATFSELSVISTEITPIKNAIERSKSAEKIDLESLDNIGCTKIDKKIEDETIQNFLQAQDMEPDKFACFQID